MTRAPADVYTPSEIAAGNWVRGATFVSYRLDWLPLVESLDARIRERDLAVDALDKARDERDSALALLEAERRQRARSFAESERSARELMAQRDELAALLAAQRAESDARLLRLCEDRNALAAALRVALRGDQ